MQYFIATINSPGDGPVRIHYADTGPSSKGSSRGKGTVLLLHGFPQTSRQFRHVTPLLAEAGYRVIAPDYRGAGLSSKPLPPQKYTKSTMAADMNVLIKEHLRISDPVHVVGHDIGAMVGWTYAAKFPQDTASLCWGECALPGTEYFDQVRNSVWVWHFNFHSVPDIAEALVTGRERTYVSHFFDKLSYNAAAISPEDRDFYAAAYSKEGALRAAFETYRAFEEDCAEGRRLVKEKGKIAAPTLVLFGDHGVCDDAPARAMGEETSENVKVAFVPDAGHYSAEENPAGFAKALLDFWGPLA